MLTFYVIEPLGLPEDFLCSQTAPASHGQGGTLQTRQSRLSEARLKPVLRTQRIWEVTLQVLGHTWIVNNTENAVMSIPEEIVEEKL